LISNLRFLGEKGMSPPSFDCGLVLGAQSSHVGKRTSHHDWVFSGFLVVRC